MDKLIYEFHLLLFFLRGGGGSHILEVYCMIY